MYITICYYYMYVHHFIFYAAMVKFSFLNLLCLSSQYFMTLTLFYLNLLMLTLMKKQLKNFNKILVIVKLIVKHNMLMLSWKIALHIIMKKSYKLKTKVFLVDPVLVSIKKGKMSILCFHLENEGNTLLFYV